MKVFAACLIGLIITIIFWVFFTLLLALIPFLLGVAVFVVVAFVAYVILVDGKI